MSIRKAFGCALIFLSIAAFSSSAPAQQSPFQSNCEDVKKLITSLSPVVEWGPFWGCRAPDRPAAEGDAAVACISVYAQGSPIVFPLVWFPIKNWVMWGPFPVGLPDTYLGYCTGLFAPGATARSAPDAAKAAEAKKKLDDALEALRKKN